jgi:PAS domain S-box-containing protein
VNNLNDNQLNRLIVESSNEGVWVIDKNQKTIYSNPKLTEMLGVSQQELLNKSVNDFIIESGTSVDKMELKQQNGTPKDYLIANHANSKFWAQVKVHSMHQNGDFSGAVLLISDISARKKIESEQAESFNYYYSLFEDSPIPIWDEDFSEVKKALEDLRLKGVENPRAYFTQYPDELGEIASKMIVNEINQAVVVLNEGSSKEDVLTNFKNLITPKSHEYALRQLEAIWNGETVCEFDAELKTLKGNYRYVHFKWSVLKGHDLDYKRIFLTTTDLTERIKEENLNLQESNREKEILLKEVHHRVKNNLQIISSLLKLQSYTTDDPRITEIIEISLSRISSMAKVHELLYKSTEFSKINYHDYLTTLLESLISTMALSNQRISYSIDVAEIQFTIDTAIPLGLLINECITNSLKHGFHQRDEGEIYIQIKKHNLNEYILFIGDNGIGFNPTQTEKKDTLGLSLIESLTEQLNGRLEHINEQEGTHFKIIFKDLR